VKTNLGDEQCKADGGRFTALTQWMIHAWIWKDSPAGVFSPTNPNVQRSCASVEADSWYVTRGFEPQTGVPPTGTL